MLSNCLIFNYIVEHGVVRAHEVNCGVRKEVFVERWGNKGSVIIITC